MKLRNAALALVLAAPLASCVIAAKGSELPRYTVFTYGEKVFRVHNRTGEVWVYEGSAWKSLGGAMHDEGGGVRVRVNDDDKDNKAR